MALPHLLVGIRERSGAHLFFVLATAATIAIALGELTMMHADSIGHFVRASAVDASADFRSDSRARRLRSSLLWYRSALAWPRGHCCALRLAGRQFRFSAQR